MGINLPFPTGEQSISKYEAIERHFRQETYEGGSNISINKQLVEDKFPLKRPPFPFAEYGSKWSKSVVRCTIHTFTRPVSYAPGRLFAEHQTCNWKFRRTGTCRPHWSFTTPLLSKRHISHASTHDSASNAGATRNRLSGWTMLMISTFVALRQRS